MKLARRSRAENNNVEQYFWLTVDFLSIVHFLQYRGIILQFLKQRRGMGKTCEKENLNFKISSIFPFAFYAGLHLRSSFKMGIHF